MGDASASFTNIGEKEMQIMPKARLSLGFMHKTTYFKRHAEFVSASHLQSEDISVRCQNKFGMTVYTVKSNNRNLAPR